MSQAAARCSKTLPYDRYDIQTRPKDWDQPRDVVELRTTTDAPAARVHHPGTLRVVRPIDTKVSPRAGQSCSHRE